MKRITILLMTLMLVIIQMAAQDTSLKGTITLSHQGKETAFAYNEMTKVMNAAVDGDTVFLSAGYFKGDFIMNKKLAFIGVGADDYNGNSNCSRYDGKIIVNLPEDTKLTARLFDAINFYNNNDNTIAFNSAIDNVIFRKCKWYKNDIWIFRAEVKNLLVDRCYCALWQNSHENLTKLVVRNSNVSSCYFSNNGNPDSRIFYNCNISAPNFVTDQDYTFNQLAYTYINCLINNNKSYLAYPVQDSYTPILVNCLYQGNEKFDVAKNCTLQNCYTSEIYPGNLTKEELLKNKYLGNDGTVVGCYGGKNPYTLDVISPTIKNTIHLDKDKKQVQFNIKITEQQ